MLVSLVFGMRMKIALYSGKIMLVQIPDSTLIQPNGVNPMDGVVGCCYEGRSC